VAEVGLREKSRAVHINSEPFPEVFQLSVDEVGWRREKAGVIDQDVRRRSESTEELYDIVLRCDVCDLLTEFGAFQ
jgi:hypothetical protein